MIQIENLSYGFPAKNLYEHISATLEAGQHCALIGSNGCGKSTLVEMIIDPEKFWFEGHIIKDDQCRIGYTNQFSVRQKSADQTVFQFLSEKFVENQKQIETVCEEMASGENMEQLMEDYQQLLDLYQAMDGDNYLTNIQKQLSLANMTELSDVCLSKISGGEYKLLQLMREMLLAPNLLVLDEPDVFLDFGNLNRLCRLINGYKGTMLVVTHNRYLLNHCFDHIWHLENGELQEFEGDYTTYRCWLLAEKLSLKQQNLQEQEAIAHTSALVDILRKRATLMVNPVIGRSVNAKQSQLDRLLERQIKAPFIEIRQPEIVLPAVEVNAEQPVLTVTDYTVTLGEDRLVNVNFQLLAGEKVAIVGANGTGKTTLIHDLIENKHPAIRFDEDTETGFLSQLYSQEEMETRTVYEMMLDYGFTSRDSAKAYLATYCLDLEDIDQKVGNLSGGEQNLLQIALVGKGKGEFLLLDEPTSHLDIHGQTAFERALSEYKGTVLMVSHDFYLVTNCSDYVLLVEGETVRPMRTKKFKRMVYKQYFDQEYLEADKIKQDLEEQITKAFEKNDLGAVEKLCQRLEDFSLKLGNTLDQKLD